MGYAQTIGSKRHSLLTCAATIAVICLAVAECAAQAAPADKQPQDAVSQELSKYPGLADEVGRLVDRLQKQLQFPPARGESRLLPLLPESTVAYVAYPNYGDTLHQALTIFRQEREESAALRAWWQHSEMAANGPKLEESLEKIYQLSQYLGDELVVSGGMDGRNVKPLIVAEVRKPGLKAFLEQMVNDFGGNSPPAVIVFDQQELEIAKDRKPGREPVVLVRPDYVIGAFDVATLRSFNARLDQSARGFPSLPFGQRIAQAYQTGVTIVGAADLQKLLSLIPFTREETRVTFQRTGFADLKYLVWEHRTVAGQDVSRAELSFLGPRHGVASWLAAPAPLGSLEFVSPKAILATSVVLISPAQIFDDVQELARGMNANAFASVGPLEQALQLSLKDDLLFLLGGEITAELDAFSPQPAWKAILQVKDADHLQKTLDKLLAMSPFERKQSEDGGVTYHTVRIPSGEKSTEIDYAFEGGYLVAASSRDAAAEAIQMHRAGESLGKSSKLLAALPPGHPPGASALFYHDNVAMTAAILRQMAPQLAGSLTQPTSEVATSVVCMYGDETAIREEGSSMAFDAGLGMAVAAIAIPNLLRSRMAANEASAVATIRNVDTAQVTYAATYHVTYVPKYARRGYARDLASLGPDPHEGAAPSAEHANLIDSTIGNASCTAGAWCAKSGYRFTMKAICLQSQCNEYVVAGTPESADAGTRNFCSTSDGVIRFQQGPPLVTPISVAECKSWAQIK